MDAKKVLVTGGAGYIGSHTTYKLVEAGFAPVVLDDLSSGSERLIAPGADFVKGSVSDRSLLLQTLDKHRISSVLHFAAFVSVEDSVKNPIRYFANNVGGTIALLEACHQHGIKNFIFSSTAAVYGNSSVNPVSEESPLAPINPYGTSKLLSEQILRTSAEAAGMKHVIFRYFNVAGARPDGKIGQMSPESTHLVKVLSEVVTGKRKEFIQYGDDYPTSDGSCVRDYVHVDDIATAHVEGLRYLQSGQTSGTFNLGYGRGVSVTEMRKAMEKVSGQHIPFQLSARRPGDAASVVANNQRAIKAGLWKSQTDRLQEICLSALNWERSLRE